MKEADQNIGNLCKIKEKIYASTSLSLVDRER